MRNGGLALVLALASLPALAVDTFTIRAVRAEGLQRLDEGTVLTYLPVAPGDELNDLTSRQSIRALYASGLFQDVELRRDGQTLVIRVKERPQIASFEITGNEKVGGDDLKKSLKEVGLVDGEVFRRALLDGVEQELRRQYYANGYYDVDIKTTVADLSDNRVDIKIKVTENEPSKIKDINIVGNKVFPADTLRDQLKLEQSLWWLPFQKSDKYSKQALGGDLESLSSYYQDRGYLKFAVRSVQVSLSPEKSDVYITVNVDEGDVYKVSGYHFTGELPIEDRLLRALVSTPEGAIFSRRESTESGKRIESVLSDIGYAFAKVTAVPEIDETNRTVAINYIVDPGKLAYVRRVTFTGHGRTRDETLRRELRQLEAAPFSKSAVERSRVRLARLPFIEEAEVDTKPVPGTQDQVDILFKIKERAPGSVQFGVGYSGLSGFLVNASLTQTNFLGTGNRVVLEAERSAISKVASVSWTNPYFTPDGVSQSASVFFRKSDRVARYSASYLLSTVGADLTYGLPLTEYTTLRAGVGIEHTGLTTTANSSDQLLAFVIANGDIYTNYVLRTGVVTDTRNRTFFADKGMLQRLNLDVNGPGSNIESYTTNYQYIQYVTLPLKFFAEVNTNLGYLDTYGKTKVPAPFERFYGGGPRSVRGYREASLGPRDSLGYNFGGQLKGSVQTNLVLPLPFEASNKTIRAALFFDAGNIWDKPADFSVGSLRQSAGLSFQWFTPFLGLLDLSYAFPINNKTGDRVDHFQINFGSGF